MPIYEYSCKKCGEEIEILHKVDEKPREPCPACGSRALVRKVSAPRFRLSGGGWYETDFKKDGKKNLKSDDRAAEAKAEAKPDKPEVKVAPKPDAKAGAPAPAKSEAKAEAKPAAKAEPKTATAKTGRPSKAA